MPRCLFHDNEARQCENEALEKSNYCQIHQSIEQDLNAELNNVVVALSALKSDISLPKKDFWDKISASATLLTGLFVGLIGIIATNNYNNRELENQSQNQTRSDEIRRVEIVQRFFPHLVSAKETEVSGALLTIATLNEELATQLAKNFEGAASIEVLNRLIDSDNDEVATRATEILDQKLLRESLRETLFASTYKVTFSYSDGNGTNRKIVGTAFLVSAEGHFITSSKLLPDLESYSISLQPSDNQAPPLAAHLIQKDEIRDVALLRAKASTEEVPFALPVEFQRPSLNDEIVSVGHLGFGGDNKVLLRGVVVSYEGPRGTWLVSLATDPGYSGAPVVNLDRKVIGYVVGRNTVDQGGHSLVRPISEIADILNNAGVRANVD